MGRTILLLFVASHSVVPPSYINIKEGFGWRMGMFMLVTF